MRTCVDCGKEVKYSERCHSCSLKNYLINNSNSRNGENNPNWKGGIYSKENTCPTCGKKIGPYSKYCKEHFIVLLKVEKKKCIDCGKVLKNQQGAIRCRECKVKFYREENHPRFKPKPNCVDCGKKLSNKNYIRCHTCENKRKWEDKKYRDSVIKGILIKPNKPETLLKEILDKVENNRWEYTGNSRFWLGRFNPDFVDKKNKQIIELFGDYWHGSDEKKIKDEERLIVYSKNGYSTLIIWENELKDLEKLTNKIIDFAYPQVKSI